MSLVLYARLGYGEPAIFQKTWLGGVKTMQGLSIIVVSTIDSSLFHQKALALGEKLRLPTALRLENCSSLLALAFTPDGLQLLHRPLAAKPFKPLLSIDFVGGKNGYRLARERTIKQPLARAVGIKAGYRPKVLDATGGLGGDALVLANLGCQVTLCERSPVLVALLEDALDRAIRVGSSAAARLRLLPVDSRHHLLENPGRYDSVYLDPMYPTREHSALNRQSMRAIRMLVGDDDDSGQLLAVARDAAKQRVAVKRPHPSPYLAGALPSHSVSMKNSRFDIYLREGKAESHL